MMKMKRVVFSALVGIALSWTALNSFAQEPSSAKAIYELSCIGCHGSGVLGAPKLGDAAQWGPRAKAGIDALVKSATAGTAKGMPPKGGRPDLSAAQLRAVIEYMMAGSSKPLKALEGAAARTTTAGKAELKTESKAAPARPEAKAAVRPTPTPTVATTTAMTLTAATVPLATTNRAVTVTGGAGQTPAAGLAVRAAPSAPSSADVNAFNRLLKPLGGVNRAAVESGIHDPANDMTIELQSPAAAFVGLTKSMAGNHVDWVKSLNAQSIAPRWDRLDPAVPAVVMDLNIVREVKGSMPDVVFPHKQHTEWLDCSNCHPAIFIPQKGANQISMASILLGQKCGVCHGKVAFPVSDCRLCHAKKKIDTAAATERKP
jgi:c(7)-type cytochrome triheme protein